MRWSSIGWSSVHDEAAYEKAFCCGSVNGAGYADDRAGCIRVISLATMALDIVDRAPALDERHYIQFYWLFA